MSRVIGYRAGKDRVEDNVLSHTYAMTSAGNLFPMCGRGWNRSGGYRFSILRGPPGSEGECLVCRRNVAAGRRPPHPRGWPHKTKWL